MMMELFLLMPGATELISVYPWNILCLKHAQQSESLRMDSTHKSKPVLNLFVGKIILVSGCNSIFLCCGHMFCRKETVTTKNHSTEQTEHL